MGLGPPIIELYRQLKLQGALEDGLNVMELGSQDYWCHKKTRSAVCSAPSDATGTKRYLTRISVIRSRHAFSMRASV